MLEGIRDACHPDLAGAVIFCVFEERSAPQQGRVSLGKAKRQGPVDRLLTGADFVIQLNKEEWEKLTLDQKRALLDHELCHCTSDDEGNWKKRPHDVEEFTEIVQRHGLWERGVEAFGKQVIQTQLPLWADQSAKAASGTTKPAKAGKAGKRAAKTASSER